MRACDTVEERQVSLSLLLHSLIALYVRMLYIALNQLLQNTKGPRLAPEEEEEGTRGGGRFLSPAGSSAPVHVVFARFG